MDTLDDIGNQTRSDAAIEWLARMRAADVTAAEKAEFAEWLAASPRNKVAFDEATALWHSLADLPDVKVAPLPKRSRPSRQWPLAAAASVLLASLVFVFQLMPDTHVTGKGEQARIVLDDGSTAFLNTDSEVAVRYSGSQRHVDLIRGEVWFDVEADAERPFIVSGQYAEARAVGTAFSVREGSDFTRIQVTEGIVAFTPQLLALEASSQRLGAGEQAEASAELTEVSAFDPDIALSWQRGQLVYQDVRLEDLLQDLNRYLPKAMSVNDDTLSGERVSAVLNLDDQDAMLEALGRTLPIRWKVVSDALIIISPVR